MSAKTRIVVLHMKKLVFAGVITGLGILLVIFLGILLGSSHKQSADNEAVETMYVPGVYTSSVMIDGNPFDVQVSVDEDHINEITMVHLDETVETMYPFVPVLTLDELAKQIISSQSLTDLTYSKNNQYTCRLLIGAVSEAFGKGITRSVMPHMQISDKQILLCLCV